VTFFCISDTLVPTTYLVDTTLSNSSDSDQTVQAVRLPLNSVTTVKRLIEVWPESKELLPKEADKASTALPALRVEDLNKMIGLPSEAA
ncbi:Nmad5 family putative nucleotide modification protein, partial [Escherichia coli]|uniref:Nmad5 family putative nucleotide modification protein n=1 Tax=Escherichia coli TaxID=562 RepID=UPI003904CF60